MLLYVKEVLMNIIKQTHNDMQQSSVYKAVVASTVATFVIQEVYG